MVSQPISVFIGKGLFASWAMNSKILNLFPFHQLQMHWNKKKSCLV